MDELGPAAATVGTDIRPTCRRPPPTRACWNGCWSTSSPTRCVTARPTSPDDHRQRARRPGRAARDRPGPGIPEDQWEHVFLPFQRLGDRDNQTGVGLGLALSRGWPRPWVAASPGDHPGGGLTMVLRLPAAQTSSEGPQE
ncbi:ATP-binding protein [Micromonospora sp. M12]